MRRESMIPFLPAALAVVTDAATAVFAIAHQPDYPGRFIVFQVVMFGAALLAAVPNKWVRFVGFVIVLAGMYITGFSVGLLYSPTFFAFVWVMTKDVRPPVQSGPAPGK
jgi:cell division protein FtsW (lipid II flippase)